ncbi:MAG: FAD-binding oxidoreductase [Phycisphaeraceae bacterium]
MTDPAPDNTIQVTGADSARAAVRRAREANLPLVDYGKAHAGLGHPPPARHIRVEKIGSVLEHQVRDMTVTAHAGCTLGELQGTLAAENQFLPIDADDDLPLGEVIEHNVFGPLRAGFGGVRDMLLGLSFVSSEAELITVGGQTVKNVAGYDVTRLIVGSLGELGLLVSATLRTWPIPAGSLTADLHLPAPELIDTALPGWMSTEAAPAWLLMTRERDHFAVRMGWFGPSIACHAQLRSLETQIDRTPDIRLVSSAECPLEQSRAERAAHRAWRRDAPALVKIVVPPASTGFVCQSLASTASGEDVRHLEALPVHGCVFVGGELDAAAARKLDEQISHLIEPVGGLRVWHQRPEGAENIAPFGPPQPDWPILGRIKKALDPHGLFNPGRFLPVGETQA